MIIRIIHTIDRAATDGPAARSTVDTLDRDRLARSAARIQGLETLIVGSESVDPEASAGGDRRAIVVLAWLDVPSMVNAIHSDESAFLRERLGLDVEIDRAESFEVMSRTFGALPTSSGILRVLTLRPRPSGDAALFEHLRAIQERLTRVGLVSSHVARRTVPGAVEAVVVGVWRDEAAVEAATEGHRERPAFHEELAPWVESVSVATYQAIEIAPRLPMASGPPILVLDGASRVVDLTPAAAAALGRSQQEAVGRTVGELAGEAGDRDGVGGTPASTGWSGLLDGHGGRDTTGGSAWPIPFGGQVLIHWRLRRDVPVAGRHVLLVRRESEDVIEADDVDAAVAEAFPTD